MEGRFSFFFFFFKLVHNGSSNGRGLGSVKFESNRKLCVMERALDLESKCRTKFQFDHLIVMLCGEIHIVLASK